MNPEEIIKYAKEEANKAAVFARLGDKEDNYCGFAWIKITPARGKFVTYLKKNNIGRNGAYGGWEISGHYFNPHSTQSMTFNEIVCRAAANALREHGVNASMMSRAD